MSDPATGTDPEQETELEEGVDLGEEQEEEEDNLDLQEKDYEYFEKDIIVDDDAISVYTDIKSQLDTISELAPESSSKKPLKTTKFLTKYERARILGVRATQIARGDKPYIDTKTIKSGVGGDLIDPKEIAELELIHRKLPYIIKRRLPSKVMYKPNHEYVHLNQLII